VVEVTSKETCLRTIFKNLDSLENLGDLPQEFVEKILKKCNPKQLRRIEEATVMS
jgi:hypothetical protein